MSPLLPLFEEATDNLWSCAETHAPPRVRCCEEDDQFLDMTLIDLEFDCTDEFEITLPGGRDSDSFETEVIIAQELDAFVYDHREVFSNLYGLPAEMLEFDGTSDLYGDVSPRRVTRTPEFQQSI